MVKVISQETYDEVVKENMEEFSMTEEEAIDDAVKQFEAQGVDLSNIIKDLSMAGASNSQAVIQSLKNLENLVKKKSLNDTEYKKELDSLKAECDRGLAQRVAVGKQGTYNVILSVMRIGQGQDNALTLACLNTIVSLMVNQPDLLDTEGIDLMLAYLDTHKDTETLHLVLVWVKECCTKHERNRQCIFDANILNHLKAMLGNADAPLLRDVCGVLRALVLDDDVRVEFGRAHEHARTIASDTLCPIIELLQKYKKDETLVSELMLTLSSLIVRNEYCKKVEDAGGLTFVLDVLNDFLENENLNRQALKLLKVLAGNDDCKMHIIQKGGANIIFKSMTIHKSSSQMAVFGLNTVAALALRSPENSKLMFEAGIPQIIVDCMKLHPDNMNVQKSGSWAIRNMVSRSRNQCEKFLSLGAEAILQDALGRFSKDCEYDLKSALRDLGCKVDFKEEWTGKGGKLTTQAVKR